MTKSTITRERAQQIFLGNGPEPSVSEERELARMALAAMDSEPVAEVYQTPNVGICAALGPSIRMLCALEPGTKLYRHAQPAPVVPVGLEHLRSIVADPRLLPRRKEWIGGQQYSYVLLEEVEAIVDEACRAAMLAAAPHDTPALNSVQNVVTVPGKWIPVSERMPEDEQEVLTINKMGHRFVSFFDKHSGLFFDRLDAPAACCIEHVLVTHWMPLPAAPQEVK
ncbi:TPA: DUF551 domain-containing protein [Klebsiella pneumoniae]|nr:DUF551 domain-containing protein [Klebsiella pneumoniae]